MLKNVGLKQVTFDSITIEGYSRAAVQSYWRIPELKLGFDLGAHPWDFMGTSTWFVTHTHLDHIAALPVYVARRRMMKMDPPTIYLPEYAVEGVQHVLRAFGKLDRGRLPCELIGVKEGQELEVSRDLIVTAYATKHTVPSLGYIVWERRKKLKEELIGLSGEQIRDLRLAGQEVSEEKRIPLVGYLGDSAPEGLDRNPDFYRVKYLITEMTFLAPNHRKEKIHKHGHMHIDDYVERADRFQNEKIIVGHISTRYDSTQARKLIEKRFPDMMNGRLVIWL